MMSERINTNIVDAKFELVNSHTIIMTIHYTAGFPMKDKRPFSLCGSKFGRLFIIIDYLVESFRPGSVDKFLHGEQKLLLGH